MSGLRFIRLGAMTYDVRDEEGRSLGTVWRTRRGWSARTAAGRTVVDEYPGSRAVAARNLQRAATAPSTGEEN